MVIVYVQLPLWVAGHEVKTDEIVIGILLFQFGNVLVHILEMLLLGSGPKIKYRVLFAIGQVFEGNLVVVRVFQCQIRKRSVGLKVLDAFVEQVDFLFVLLVGRKRPELVYEEATFLTGVVFLQ